MSSEFSVVPCEGRRDWKLFERIPELLHGGLPNFRPPFPGRVAALRRPSHPFRAHGRVFPFIAYMSDRPVGRIAAIVNETHNNFHGDSTGFFGFFDFVDDGVVARALFETAAQQLRGAGCTRLRGPFSPSQNEECGVLVSGFDAPPSILMPFNPEYYAPRYEELGLEQARELYAYRFDSFDGVNQRIGAIVERTMRRNELTVRVAEFRDRKELARLASLFNDTLDGEWNFMPSSPADLAAGAREMWPVRARVPLLVAELRGEPVGFSLLLPNLNEFMQLCRSSEGLLRFIRLAWYATTRVPATYRLAALGVRAEFRAKGVAQALYLESARLRRGTVTEAGWIQDVNPDLNTAVRAMGLELAKTYRIYETALGD